MNAENERLLQDIFMAAALVMRTSLAREPVIVISLSLIPFLSLYLFPFTQRK